MSFWTAIVIIVAIVTVSEIYRARLKATAKKSEEFQESFTERIERLETRMANLETIVLDKEKAKRFSDI